MKGNDVDEVIFVLLPVLMCNNMQASKIDSIVLLFGIGIFRRMLTPKMSVEDTRLISELLITLENVWYEIFGGESFTFKFHQVTVHLQHEILTTCSPIDVSTSGFEACNKILKEFGVHCQRGYIKEAAQRTLLLKKLTLDLKELDFFDTLNRKKKSNILL